jgi:hypothetical protein
LEADSKRQRDRYAVREVYQRRAHRRQPYRNGYYERDFVTRVGTIRLRVARTREKSFLPGALEPFQRRAGDVAMLIREAFLRGISTRHVARVVATLTGEVVSPQTVSKLPPSVAETAHHQRDRALLFWKCDEPVPWCALSMCKAWTESSTPSSRDSIWNGKTAPSTYLHKELDITPLRLYLTSRPILVITMASHRTGLGVCRFGGN